MTRRVHLLTTGACERLALHESLARLFANADAEFVPTKGLTTSFTSAFVGGTPAVGLRTTAEKFADELVATMDEADRDDIVVGVDDLEIDNVPRPDAVVALLRRSVVVALGRYQASAQKRQRLQDALRTRCSFHLLVPMVEAYFFADPNALVRAGAKRLSLFNATAADAERFLVTDEDFTRTPDTTHPNPEKRKQSWARPGRERHPKLYLKFLCDPADQYGRSYRETVAGVAALGTLGWQHVLAPATYVRFARSFVSDVADALAVPNPIQGELARETSGRPRDAVLRNV